MGNIIVMEETTKNPLELIGVSSGVCWGANIENTQKNIERGRSNLKSGHMRTAEFPQVYLVIDGYSARVIRELYTHIGGGPTRLQASTRYIQYGAFDFITPPSIEKNKLAKDRYDLAMKTISECYCRLEELNIPKEDIANILPLGMTTKIVLRTNLRNLIDMSHQRMCTRAYWEFRNLFNDIIKALSEYSEQWAEIIKDYFKPKCEVCGFCEEEKTCGRKPSKEKINEIYKAGKIFIEEANGFLEREQNDEIIFVDEEAKAFERILDKL